MNGSDASSALPKFTMPVVGNPEVIGLLEQALGAARAGKVSSVGLVLVAGPRNVNAMGAGPELFEINLGCDLLKRALLENATGKRSPILRPV